MKLEYATKINLATRFPLTPPSVTATSSGATGESVAPRTFSAADLSSGDLSSRPAEANGGWRPAMELKETLEVLWVQLQLPGFRREEIEVQVTPVDVVIRGAHFATQGLSRACVLASEFHYGPFDRLVVLPCQVVPDQVRAEFYDGLLTLYLPKAIAL